MEEMIRLGQDDDSTATASPHRRSPSGSGLLSRLTFMQGAADIKPQTKADDDEESVLQSTAMAAAVHQHKTRQRRGSLRKVALLGRGAQRERRDDILLTVANPHHVGLDSDTSRPSTGAIVIDHDPLGFKLVDSPHRARANGQGGQSTTASHSQSSASTTGTAAGSRSHTDRDGERSNSYTSTTDEEDLLQIPSTSLAPPRNGMSTSGSDSYFANRGTGNPRRSFRQVKSPLSVDGISTNALPSDSDWDYTETEWWGWVVLTVTWFVFIIGMGSCLEIWSWAWDVGKTPYAPPELEDDPTLPIVGYYPALIIMTGVMAWVWVVVAWVGMKYFRHAKISGD
ncbi:hypothetical protein DCS_06258 [Drechmeria coniospora]|uniref:Uncharacterized protein n=1 Tax=Drechmeria coniospora TaxID=98403 RepID=A0A151GB82_DRECN|nr:hypothetical protein DCS_06258 [Drechmeria coniospora]KYK54301.1 hypothetical protein DCS_06258 [Drechmeria coniospora]ODA77408.1 hypothetical protein RJ55_07037 [Drechmeria coniospora]